MSGHANTWLQDTYDGTLLSGEETELTDNESPPVSKNTTCYGCTNNIDNQEAHYGSGGCLQDSSDEESDQDFHGKIQEQNKEEQILFQNHKQNNTQNTNAVIYSNSDDNTVDENNDSDNETSWECEPRKKIRYSSEYFTNSLLSFENTDPIEHTSIMKKHGKTYIYLSFEEDEKYPVTFKKGYYDMASLKRLSIRLNTLVSKHSHPEMYYNNTW